jgi:hypothetical protein
MTHRNGRLLLIPMEAIETRMAAKTSTLVVE